MNQLIVVCVVLLMSLPAMLFIIIPLLMLGAQLLWRAVMSQKTIHKKSEQNIQMEDMETEVSCKSFMPQAS